MKKILLMLLCLVASLGAWAENPVTLINGEKSITVSSYYTGDVYTLTITSETALAGLGGSFWNVPGSGNEDVRTHMTKVDEKTLQIVVTATAGPQLYTPLYVLMPGEVNFGQPTFDWQEDLGTGEECDLALTSNASLNFDLADTEHLTSQIAYTTSSTGAVTYKSGNNAVATVSESGLITAVGVGSTTITVSQASDATYKKGNVVINVTVANSNFGPSAAPTAPAHAAEKVLGLYTDRYDLAINPTYKTDNWGSSPLTEERLIGDDHVRIYQMTGGVIVWGENNGGNNAIRGLDGKRTESYTGLNAAQMEYLHVDIWCDHVRNFTSIINDEGRGAQGETTANAWKSYDVPLAGIKHGEAGIENVRWMKFDGFVAGDVVAIANVYFYTTQDLNQASVLTMFSATASSQLTKVGEGNTINLDVKDQLSRPINDATITYTVDPADAGNFAGNVYTPAKAGWATITAHASYNGENLDAASFQVLAHVGDNLVRSASLPTSKVIAQVAENPEGATDAFFAIDGNDGSIWETKEPAGAENHMFDAWFVVDLGANYDLELATVYFEGASSKNYDIEVASTYNGNETVWTKIVEGATTPGMQNITNIHENLSAATSVRYVRYFSHQAATGYGHKIYEFQVFGTEAAAAPTATITLNALCNDGDKVYGTYSNESAFVVPSNLTVSEVGVADGVLNVVSYNVGDVVPANTGVMVSAAEGGDYTITLSEEEGTHPAGVTNALHPSSEDMTDENNLYYRLTMHNGETIGFWWGAENGAAFSLAANKAYLAVPKSAGSNLRLWFGDETVTGIEGVEASTNDVIFNLQGQRINRVQKGVNIVNGKLMIVR